MKSVMEGLGLTALALGLGWAVGCAHLVVIRWWFERRYPVLRVAREAEEKRQRAAALQDASRGEL